MSRRVLRNDTLLRRGSAPSRPGGRGAIAFILVLASLALLVLSWLDHSGLRSARWRLAEAAAPALAALAHPIDTLRALGRDAGDFTQFRDELRRLREENQRLRGWEWRARELERKLGEVAAIARTLPEQSLPFLTARIVANSSGPFVRSGLIDAGRRHGLKPGFPVMTADGLAGRLLNVGETYSRVLFLTDVNSRIPVLVGERRTRALLIGDNGPWPWLDFLGAPVQVAPGDDVETSGVGGLFPRGLRIGLIVAPGERPRVSPLGRIDHLSHVSILLYDSPDRALDARAGPAAPPSGPSKRPGARATDGS